MTESVWSEGSFLSAAEKGSDGGKVGGASSVWSVRTVDSKPLAAERWNIQKQQLKFEDSLLQYYRDEMRRCKDLESALNKKAEALYNNILSELKWAHPSISSLHSKLILDYCKHLIKKGSFEPFPKEGDLRIWNIKAKGSTLEKLVVKMKQKYHRLFRIISRRDNAVASIHRNLEMSSEKMRVKNEGTLRWMMERNRSKRDEYFSIWYLARTNKLRELQVLIASKTKMAQYGEEGINCPDPEFCLTALHYACREAHFPIVQYLLSLGAEVNIAGPDGRTPLHYAAAHADREIVLALMGAGAIPTARDQRGLSALDHAKQSQNKKTFPTLQHWEELMDFTTEDDEVILKELEEASMHSGLAPSPLTSPTRSKLFESHSVPAVPTVEQLAQSRSFVFPEASALWTAAIPAPPSTSEGVDSTPWEYGTVPAVTFQKMSRSLQFLVQRLNGYNPYLIRRQRMVSELETTRWEGQKANPSYQEKLYLSQTNWPSVTSVSMQTPTFLWNSSMLSLPYNPELHASTVHAFPSAVMTNPVDHSAHLPPAAIQSTADSQMLSPESRIIEPNEPYPIPSGVAGGVSAILDPFCTPERKHACLTEIRLCTKFFFQCIDEGFMDEAVRVLHRRWTVAKHLHYLVRGATRKRKDLLKQSLLLPPVVDSELPNTADQQALQEDSLTLDADLGAGEGQVEEEQDQEAITEKNQPQAAEAAVEDALQEEAETRPVDLERLATDFLRTFTIIEYLPATPAEASDRVVPSESEQAPSSSVQPPTSVQTGQQQGQVAAASTAFDDAVNRRLDRIHQVSEKLFVEDDASSLRSRQTQSAASIAAAELPVHDVIQRLLQKYADDGHRLRLEEYAWRYENVELIDHYTTDSSTTAGSTLPSGSDLHGRDRPRVHPVLSTEYLLATSVANIYEQRTSNALIDGSQLSQDSLSSSLSLNSWDLSIRRHRKQQSTVRGSSRVTDDQESLLSSSLPPDIDDRVAQRHVENYCLVQALEFVEVLLVRQEYTHVLLCLEDALSMVNDGVLITLRIRALFQLCDLVLYLCDHCWPTTEELANTFGSSSTATVVLQGTTPTPTALLLQGTKWFRRREASKAWPRQFLNIEEQWDTLMQKQTEQPELLSFVRGHQKSDDGHTRGVDLEGDREDGNDDDMMRIRNKLLRRGVAAAQEAIDLGAVLSARHVFEPMFVARSLGFLGLCRERLGDVLDACEILEEASLLAKRVAYGTDVAIELLLESMRVHVKYVCRDRAQLQIVSQKAFEVNKMIEVYAPQPTDLQADRWWRRSAELLAIATTAVRDPFQTISGLDQEQVQIQRRNPKEIKELTKRRVKYL